jgi:hypothetical protein
MIKLLAVLGLVFVFLVYSFFPVKTERTVEIPTENQLRYCPFALQGGCNKKPYIFYDYPLFN